MMHSSTPANEVRCNGGVDIPQPPPDIVPLPPSPHPGPPATDIPPEIKEPPGTGDMPPVREPGTPGDPVRTIVH